MRLPSMTRQSPRLRKFDQSWHRCQLATGITVLFGPKVDDAHFHLSAMVRTGTRQERDGRRGITHLLEHMMFRGSVRYPSFSQLAEAFSWMGGEWNAGTGHEHTEFWFSGHRRAAREVINLFGDFLCHPTFEGLDIERQIVFREIEGELNEFGLNTDIDLHIHQLLWPKSSLAHPLVGYKEQLSTLAVSDLKSHMRDHYSAQNTVICIMGIGHDPAIETALNEAFNSFPQKFTKDSFSEKTKTACGPHVRLVPHTDSEYQLQLSFLCQGEWSTDALLYDILSQILTDGFTAILGHRIREELGLVYDIDSQASLLSDTGTFDICATVHPDRVMTVLQETQKILMTLCQQGPSDTVTTRAAQRAAMELELLPEQDDVMAFRQGWAYLCQTQYSLEEKYLTTLDVTAERIQEICQKLFTRSNLALVLIGPENSRLHSQIQNWAENWPT